ncbi:Synapse-associated protein 1 [Geranomyces michiganensis]|nr:Synapse-associated protein 1 [Geranomyces michiganensis]
MPEKNPPQPPTDFAFDLEAAYPTILAMLRLDARLGQLRFELVPKKMKEPQFWRLYFWRICQLRADPASAIPAVDVDVARESSNDAELLFTAPDVEPITTSESPRGVVVAIPAAESGKVSPSRSQSPSSPSSPSPSPPRADSPGSSSLPTAQDLRDEQPVPPPLPPPVAPKDLADEHSFDGYVPEEFVSDMYEQHDEDWQERVTETSLNILNQ